MKKTEALKQIKDELEYYLLDEHKKNYNLDLFAEAIMTKITTMGMRPPSVGSPVSDALTSIYVFPNYNQWDEAIEADEKVTDLIARWTEIGRITPEGKIKPIYPKRNRDK